MSIRVALSSCFSHHCGNPAVLSVCLFVCCQASRLPLFIKPFHAITYPLQTAHMLLVARSYAVRMLLPSSCDASLCDAAGLFSAFLAFSAFSALSVGGATVDRLAQL